MESTPSLAAHPPVTRKRGRDAAEESDKPGHVTAENPLGIRDAPAYRIIVPSNTTFADTVAEPDLDMIRKMAQVAFYFYRSPKTTNMYVTYDPNDKAYEVTFSFPMDTEVDMDLFTALYRLNPMLVTKKPWVVASYTPNRETGEMQVLQNVTMRYASYRRSHVTIHKTCLMIWETEATFVPSEDVFDNVRPAKRIDRSSKDFAHKK